MSKREVFEALGVLAFVSAILFLLPKMALAGDTREPEVKIIDATSGTVEHAFLAYPEIFRGGASVTACDLDGDGIDEIITGAGPGGGPQVRIFNHDGATVFTPGFFAYDQKMRAGVTVACGDLDGDGQAEIVTGTKFGAAPQVRIFDRYGTPVFTPGFFAYDTTFRGGVNVAVADIDGSGLPEIITAPGAGGGPHIRVFNRFGQSLNKDFYVFHQDFKGGVNLAAANVDGGPDDELIFSVARYDSAWIKVIKLSTNQVLGQFTAFPTQFTGGATVTGADVDNDGFDEIVAAAGQTGAPHVRSFEIDGTPLAMNFFAYEREFRGGVSIAEADFGTGDNTLIVGPTRRIAEGRQDLAKYIDIDISEQMLRYYENGQKIGEHRISTGKWSMPTPLGTFKTTNKILVAYSKPYSLYMDYWMAFAGNGAYGIHSLPYWKIAGGRIYEGENHLGVRVSHGCVRQSLADSKKLYEWASVGTTVIVHD